MNQQTQDIGVSSAVKREIQKHHRSLKQFIDVSYDSTAPVRKNSKRATKAREKLLKLSQAQFIELSTDVYDELHRRINETKDEPDHLLPRESFHPKRNQAREKLASLPAQRFKDLVNDILFEIERRYLHITDSPIASYDLNDYNSNIINNNNHNNGSTESAMQASQHGVQAKTVIPTKATMAWSSEEEDDEEVENNNNVRNSIISSRQNSRPQSYIIGEQRHSFIHEKRDAVPEMVSITSPTANKHNSTSSIKRGLSINKDREIQMLLEEGTKMDVKITDLERDLEAEREKVSKLELENKSLSEQIDQNRDRFNSELSQLTKQVDEAPKRNEYLLVQSQYDALQSSHSIINDKYSSLSDDFDRLKKEKEDLEFKLKQLTEISKTQETRSMEKEKSTGQQMGSYLDDSLIKEIQDQLNKLAHEEFKSLETSHSDDSESQIALWKQRFEQSRFDQIYGEINKADISESLFQDFVSVDGLISIKQLSEFRVSVETFYLELTNVGYSKDNVFKAASILATKADSMCLKVASDNKLLSILKSCISHAVIVARHYLTFSHALPPIVLHIAVNDVAVAVCDLIKSVKLLSSSKEKNSLETNQSEISTPVLSKIEPPSSFFDKNDLSSPVRPLRMIERLNSPTVGNDNKFPENDKNPKTNSIFEKRLALANSPLAPISTQLTTDLNNTNTKSVPVTSPRGPGIISLANKYGNSAANKQNGPTNTSPKTSPTSSNILDRMKKFESPEQEEVNHSKIKIPENTNSDGFIKFGARRRSSLTDPAPVVTENGIAKPTKIETPSSTEKKVDVPKAVSENSSKSPDDDNTNVDLNEIPSHESSSDIDLSIEPLSVEAKVKPLAVNQVLLILPDTQDHDKNNEQVPDVDYDKTVAAAKFNIDNFNITNPDNTLHELLLYLEHQTMDVISTIQTLLASIKKQDSTRGVLRDRAKAINVVVGQMTEATNISMNQTRNVQLREHGSWVVQNLEDCSRRMDILCGPNNKTSDADYADKNFKQRLAGVAFDIAKSTKELVKSVEELSLKQDIAMLDARLNN